MEIIPAKLLYFDIFFVKLLCYCIWLNYRNVEASPDLYSSFCQWKCNTLSHTKLVFGLSIPTFSNWMKSNDFWTSEYQTQLFYCFFAKLWTFVFIFVCLDTVIGFTTGILGDIYTSSSGIIKGSPILYNQGNAYNGTVFTCPSPGLYLFQVSIISSTNGKGVWIYKNFEQITFAFTGNSSPYGGGSVSAALWLDINDQVFLRSHYESIQIDSNSAFTGVKIT